MEICELLLGKDPCGCGMAHKCPIDSVVIGNNALDSLPNLIENYKNILLVADDEVIALQNKMGWYSVDRIRIYKEKWDEIRNILKSAPASEKMLELCEMVGLYYNNYKDLYGEKKISDALLYAKDLKDRYTVLWMYYDLF